MTIDLAGAARFGPDLEWVRGIDYAVDLDACRHFLPRPFATTGRNWMLRASTPPMPAYGRSSPVPASRREIFAFRGRREHGVAGIVNLFGMESPGLTASLALGESCRGMTD